MLPGYRSLLLGACALLLVSGCGSSSTGSSSGSINVPGGGTGGTGGGPTGNPIGGGSGPTGSTNSVVGTPSVAGTVSVIAGVKQTISITFTSSDGRAISGFGISGSLGTLPAGWSGPASFACASVSTGSGCVLNLTYAPVAVGSGALTLDYVFVDNATVPNTSGSLTIAYVATPQNNIVAAASPTGQINAVVGGGSQSVIVNFTTDDGGPATALTLTTDLTMLPAGWSSTATSFTCSSLSSGNGCQLHLTYAPAAAGGGTLTLNYAYQNDAGAAKTGALNIAYRATTNDNVVGTPSPNPVGVVTGSNTPVNVTFTTDDGNLASNLSVTSGLAGLPSGWSSTSSSFACSNVSVGTGCQLSLTYAPTAVGSGTLSLTYSYNDDSGTVKSGSVGISYTAMAPPHLYVAQLTQVAPPARPAGALYYCLLNTDGTVSTCAQTGDTFSAPTGIAFNGRNFAYVADDNTSYAVYLCNVGLDGTLSGCTRTGNNFQTPWQLAINGGTLYATNVTGGVTACTINADGTLSPCTESAGTGTSGIAVSSGFAYIGPLVDTVSVCAIGVSGTVSGVCSSNSGFLGVDGITLSGGYAYIANENGGSVSVCPINANGSLSSSCATYSIGVTPTDVAIKGSQAYVNDAYGNIYLCVIGAGGALTSCAPSGGTGFNSSIQIAVH